MSNLSGYNVGDPNYILRFAIIVFMGVIAMGSVLFWRTELMMTSEYQEMPVTHEQLKIKKENFLKQQSMAKKLQNQLIQTEE